MLTYAAEVRNDPHSKANPLFWHDASSAIEFVRIFSCRTREGP